MSTGTKSLRTILAHYQKITGPGRIPRPIPLESALSEVEAIERVSRVMDKWNRDGQPRLDPTMARAWGLMEAIAKDAP